MTVPFGSDPLQPAGPSEAVSNAPFDAIVQRTGPDPPPPDPRTRQSSHTSTPRLRPDRSTMVKNHNNYTNPAPTLLPAEFRFGPRCSPLNPKQARPLRQSYASPESSPSRSSSSALDFSFARNQLTPPYPPIVARHVLHNSRRVRGRLPPPGKVHPHSRRSHVDPAVPVRCGTEMRERPVFQGVWQDFLATSNVAAPF